MRSRNVIVAVIVAVVAVVVLFQFLSSLDVGSGASADAPKLNEQSVSSLLPPVADSISLPAPQGADPEPLTSETPEVSDLVQLIVTDASNGLPITTGSIFVRPEDWEVEEYRDRLPWRIRSRAFTQALVRGEAFPEALSVRDADPVVWIGSAGYAWRSASVTEAAATLRVALQPAGDLTLRFSEELASRQESGSWDDFLEVELRHEGHQLVCPTEYGRTFLANPGDVRELGGTPTGAYELIARVNSPLGLGQVLVKQALEVQQGVNTSVLVNPTNYEDTSTLTLFLQLDDTGASKEALLTQSVRVFRHEQGSLQIVGFDSRPEWVEVAPNEVWELSYPNLAAGTYQIFLDPCALSQEVELSAGEESALYFELTDLARVSLNVEDCTVDGMGVGLIWGYQENSRRLRKYIILDPGDSVVDLECVAKPLWAQVVGVGLASEPTFFRPSPSERLEWRIGCSPEHAASARVAVFPGESSPSPDSSEFWNRVRFRGKNSEGLLHSKVPWSHGEKAAEYPKGTYLATLVFDTPGEYEMEYESRWGKGANALLPAGVDQAPVLELRLE